MHWHVRVGKCPHRVSFFHKITKAFNQESSWMEKRHCPPKQRKRSLTAQTLLLSRARGFRSAASARPKIWDPPLKYLSIFVPCAFTRVPINHSPQGYTSSNSETVQAWEMWLFLQASMSELSLGIHVWIISFFTMRPHLPCTYEYGRFHYNSICTSLSIYWLYLLFIQKGRTIPFTWGCMFGSPCLKCIVVLKLMNCL